MTDKVVGVLGGGQLGRMLAEAANRLNVKVVVLDKAGAPAKKITNHEDHVDGSFKDEAAIQALAAKSDILTIEIEHVDAAMLERMEEKGMTVEPSAKTITTIQDKYLQKQYLIKAGVAVAKSIALQSGSQDELLKTGKLLGFPFMLKTRKDAYDGRGNYPVMSEEDISAASKALGSAKGGLYAEKWAPFTKELAVMVINTKDGAKSFPVVETVHENSICKLVYAPARGCPNSILRAAQDLAKKAVSSFSGKGVYGVEMFLLPDNSLLINEIAPRPHNSGHYTIEACPLSQYDAHLRAILDLPIPDASLELREPAIMLNILGGHTGDAHVKFVYDYALSNPRTAVHLYAKGNGTPGRKMGHVTVTAKTMSECESLIAPLVNAVDESLAQKSTPADPNPKPSPLVAVIMGSDSDLPTLRPGLQLLQDWNIPTAVQITSAHRTPEYMAEFASTAAQNGIQIIIAAAGGAAHLPGMAAAHTPLPVIGVPVKGSSLDGVDSLYSIVQMPRGVPVASVAINNSLNAALLAARILGVNDPRIREKVEAHAAAAKEEVRGKDTRLVEIGWEGYLRGMGK